MATPAGRGPGPCARCARWHDPVWTADGYISDRWRPVSPVIGPARCLSVADAAGGLAFVGRQRRDRGQGIQRCNVGAAACRAAARAARRGCAGGRGCAPGGSRVPGGSHASGAGNALGAGDASGAGHASAGSRPRQRSRPQRRRIIVPADVRRPPRSSRPPRRSSQPLPLRRGLRHQPNHRQRSRHRRCLARARISPGTGSGTAPGQCPLPFRPSFPSSVRPMIPALMTRRSVMNSGSSFILRTARPAAGAAS